MPSLVAHHFDKTLLAAQQEIAENAYSASFDQPARKTAIQEVYDNLSPETKQYLDVWADKVCLNQRQKLIGKEPIKPMLNREGAIELIMTTLFCSDWYPTKTEQWKYLQKVPRINANNNHNPSGYTYNRSA